MKYNQLLDHWTGSGELVKSYISARDGWERKVKWIIGSIVVLIMLLVVGSLWFPLLDRFALMGLGVFVGSTIALHSRQPKSEHAQKYFEARDRLAKALGMKREELEATGYYRLRDGIVLPKLDGLFAELRAQVRSGFNEDARATHGVLEELHSACPPFCFLDETEGRYTLEPFEFYTRPLVSA